MATPILTQSERLRARTARPAPDRAWRALGWFGAALAVIGLAEAAVYLYPPGLGSREWEFGVSAQLLGSLPLPTMGLAGLLAAAVARGNRAGLYGLAVGFAMLGLVAFALLVLFWLAVPLALDASAAAQPVIRQTIARATIAGAGFGILYCSAAVFCMVRARVKPDGR